MPSLLLEWPIARGQAFINAILAHADNTEALFAPLQQKRIRFMLEPMSVAIEMECKGKTVLLSTETPRPVHLTLTGTPIQFLSTFTQPSTIDLHIAGDGKIAHALQRALGHLDIDVEAFLETIVGGTLAHTLMKSAQHARRASAQFATHTLNDLSDYCHYEINTTASQEEVTHFAQEVNTLRYAVDHLAVKIAQLKRRAEEIHVQ